MKRLVIAVVALARARVDEVVQVAAADEGDGASPLPWLGGGLVALALIGARAVRSRP